MKVTTFVSASLFFLSVTSNSIANKQNIQLNSGVTTKLPANSTAVQSKSPVNNIYKNDSILKTNSNTNLATQNKNEQNSVQSNSVQSNSVQLTTIKIISKEKNITQSLDASKNQTKIPVTPGVKNQTKSEDKIKAPPKSSKPLNTEQEFAEQNKEPPQRWVMIYETCPVTCGGGYQSSTPTCWLNGVTAGDDVCEKVEKKPAPQKSVCAQQPCFTPRWEVSQETTMCSVTCGSGDRVRVIRCVITLGSSSFREVESRMCNPATRPKSNKEACQAAVTCPPAPAREGDCTGNQCNRMTTKKGIGGSAEYAKPQFAFLLSALWFAGYNST